MSWYWPWSRPVEDISKSPTSGPGGFTSSAPTAPPTKPSGSDGVAVYGGFLVTGERDPRLQNRQKWVTFSEQELNVPIVATAINIWTQMLGSAKWTCKPNPKGGKDGEKAAGIIREGIFEAQMATPWQQVVRRQGVKKFRGFALHEAIIRRRKDGMVVIADLLDRPQWTVWRWNKPDDQSAWESIEQLTHYGTTKSVPRGRLFYSVENTLTASPDGVGLHRMLAEPTRLYDNYTRWEGIGLQTDLRGIPIARLPFDALRKQVDPGGVMSDDELTAKLKGKTQFVIDFLMNHNKRSDQGIALDSATYHTLDAPQTPSSIPLWGLEILKGATSGLPDVNTAIGRIVRDLARICGAEFLLLGDVGSGSDAMHEDKTAMFGLYANSCLDDIAADAKRDLATRLVALNGLDTETCVPELQHEPVMKQAVLDATRALMQMFQAGLNPRDEAINILRNRMDLPDAPSIDETDLLLPRGTEIESVSPDGRITAVDPNAVPASGSVGSKPAVPPAVKPAPNGTGRPTTAAPGQAGNVNARPTNGAAKP